MTGEEGGDPGEDNSGAEGGICQCSKRKIRGMKEILFS